MVCKRGAGTCQVSWPECFNEAKPLVLGTIPFSLAKSLEVEAVVQAIPLNINVTIVFKHIQSFAEETDWWAPNDKT